MNLAWVRNNYVIGGALISLVALSLISLGVALQPFSSESARKSTERHVRTFNGVEEYVLQNGLRVLLIPDTSSAAVAVNITYLVGSRHEGYGETGMAHLIEHMMFKGSKNHTDIPVEISEYATEANATTWVDRTNYYEVVTADPVNIDWALSLEADRMHNAFFNQKDLESEFSVVRNEMEIGENDPAATLSEQVTNVAFTWHNYGKSTIGARSDVERVPAWRLKEFYKKYYQPNNAVLVVAGNFTSDEMRKKIQKEFGLLKKSEKTIEETYTVEPPQEGERTVRIERVGGVPQLAVSYHVPGAVHPDIPALDVLAHILGQNPSGPLYSELVSRNIAVDASAYLTLTKDPGQLLIAISQKNETAAQRASREVALRELLDALPSATFLDTYISDAQITRAKNEILESYRKNETDAVSFAIGLTEFIALGDWRSYFLHQERLKNVTRDDVLRVAGKYLQASNRTLGIYTPVTSQNKVHIPEVTAQELQQELSALVAHTVIESGEVMPREPLKIEERITRKKIGNISVSLVPKETRDNQVFVEMQFHVGTVTGMRGYGVISDILPQLFFLGTTTLSKEEIQEKLVAYKATATVTGSGGAFFVSIQCPKESLTEVMNLVYDVVRNPLITPATLETAREQALASTEGALTDPEAVIRDAQTKHYDPYARDDIRANPTSVERVAALRAMTAAQVASFFKDFYGTSRGEIAVVGEFVAADIEKVISEKFGIWASKKPYERITYQPVTAEPIRAVMPVSDKQNAVYYAVQPIQMVDTDPEYPAFLVADAILGSDPFASRITARVREKEGMSYSSGSALSVDRDGPTGRFMIHAVGAPQNILKVESSIADELRRMQRERVPDEEFIRIKKGLINYMRDLSASDASLAQTIVWHEYNERTLAFQQRFLDALETVTPADVQRIAKKYFSPEQFSVFISGDLKGE